MANVNHYHCRERFINRSGRYKYQQSSVAYASYLTSEKLYNEETQQNIHRRDNSKNCVYNEIFLPENAPKEYADRQTLHNAIMQKEHRKNAQFIHEIEFSLSNKLTLDEAKTVAREICTRLQKEGMICDMSIHWKDENHHCHILTTVRPLSRDGTWGEKSHTEVDKKTGKKYKVNNIDWFDKDKILERRKWVADLQNVYLAPEDQISEKTLKAQGIERDAMPNLTRRDYEIMKKAETSYDPEEKAYISEEKITNLGADDAQKIQLRICDTQIKNLEREQTLEAIAEEKTDDLEQRLHDIAIKTLPDTVQWHPLDRDDIDEYGEYNVLVSEAWMRKYNRYLEKAGMDEYKVDSPLGVCQRLAPDCEVNNLHTYWSRAEIVMPNKDVKKVMEKAFKIQQEKAKIKNTPAPVPVTPTKKTTPVQTAHSQIGSVIAAGIEDLGGRSGGQAVSEQTIDDMTSGMSKMTAVIIRMLADALKQMTKGIRKDPSKIKEPRKNLTVKEKPVKEEKKEPEAPKIPEIQFFDMSAEKILSINTLHLPMVNGERAYDQPVARLKSMVTKMKAKQVKAFNEEIAGKTMTLKELTDTAVKIITASGSGAKNKDKNVENDRER